MTREFESQRPGSSVLQYLSRLGPTWLAGAIAAGPATMASVLVAGASFGYALLWVVILSALFGALAQYLATRLALVTGEGIVSTVERRFGSVWAWILVADVVLAAGLAQLVIMKTLADVSALVSGVDARLWGGVWAIVIAIGLAGGGYRLAELGAKVIVSVVVLAFVASLFVVPIDIGSAATGLVPAIPAGVSGALLAAGVLGGAVHITIITMQTYTVRARGWDEADRGIARFDIVASMIGAFGLFSLAIFLVAAGALYGVVDPSGLTAIAAAGALEPIAGTYAQWLFLFGLLGAAVSTLGGNTIVPPFLVADKLGWETNVSDTRYRSLLAATALVSAAGAFIEGSFLQLLVLVLAFGLVGTPFAIAVVVLLLNDAAIVEQTPGPAVNLGAVALFAVTSVLAGSFVRDELAGGIDPLTGFVLLFAAGMTIATVVLIGSRVIRSDATDAETLDV
ncbi:MAG: NRAMP family divalent metal transporter [Halobacteriota archaeon]